MARYLKVSEVAEQLGVHPSTLRNWIRSGEVKALRTKGGHYRIPESEVKRLLEIKRERPRAVIYARVQSRGLRDELERQVLVLKRYCNRKGYRLVSVITDVSPAVDERREGLRRLLSMAAHKEVDVIVVAYRDRLARFCLEYIEELLKGCGVKLDVIFGDRPPWGTEELMEDLIWAVKSLACKIYGPESECVKKLVGAVKRAMR